MIDPRMPDEAVEAGARVLYDELEGPIANQDYGRQLRQWEQCVKMARASIAAAINAWPGMWQDDLSQQFLTVWEKQFLILPLPASEEKP